MDNRVEASRSAGSNPPGQASGQSPDEDASDTQVLLNHNGSAAARPSPSPASTPAPKFSATQPMPSLMAPGIAAVGEGPSLPDTAAQAMATAASGAKNVAAKIGASFSGITKPRPKPSRREARSPVPPPPGPVPASAPAPPPPSAVPQAPPAPPRVQVSRPPRRGGRWQGPAGPAPRSALLSLQRVEPLSVMKFSFMVSLVGWVVVFVAVAIVYYALQRLGVFTRIEQTVGLVTYSKSHPGANAASWFRASRVLGYTAIICTVNAILFTALATLGAALYNLITTISGGIEVTLKETD